MLVQFTYSFLKRYYLENLIIFIKDMLVEGQQIMWISFINVRSEDDFKTQIKMSSDKYVITLNVIKCLQLCLIMTSFTC